MDCGDEGMAMYIIQDGSALFESGHQYQADNEELGKNLVKVDHAERSKHTRTLTDGDSFGEEIILGLEEEYHYAIVSATDLTMLVISKKGFQEQFSSSPQLLHRMTENFINHAEVVDASPQKLGLSKGRASVLCPSDAFPDIVLDTLAEIKNMVSDVEAVTLSKQRIEKKPAQPSLSSAATTNDGTTGKDQDVPVTDATTGKDQDFPVTEDRFKVTM